MKKLSILLLMCLSLIHCSTSHHTQKIFNNISIDGLEYKGTHIYYNGELCATMTAVELSYDGGEIVKEITFVIVSSKFNEQALPIIKLIRSKSPSIEVEVELKSNPIEGK